MIPFRTCTPRSHELNSINLKPLLVANIFFTQQIFTDHGYVSVVASSPGDADIHKTDKDLCSLNGIKS